MLKLVTLLFPIVIALNSYAHDFYFAFAEVAYDEITEQLQVTVIATTHDIEKSLLINGNKAILSAENTGDSLLIALLSNVLNNGLQFSSGDKRSDLKLEGFEPQLNGTTLFYLSCPFKNEGDISISFSLLMDVFPEQQNKITWIYRGSKETYVFLPTMRSQIIRTNSENEK